MAGELGANAVAPLPSPPMSPATNDGDAGEFFSVGKLLGGDPTAPVVLAPEREESASYIPVALARAHLARVVADMHAMKEEQVRKMSAIVDRYQAIERETKAYYEDHIVDLRRQAKLKFQAERGRYESLEAEARAQAERARAEMAALEDKRREDHAAHEHERRRWLEQLEVTLLGNEEHLARLHDRLQGELQRVAAAGARALDGAQRRAHDQVLMCWEDARAEAARVAHTVHSVQRQFRDRERQYQDQIAALERDYAVELEAHRCVQALVNRIVDMDHQVTKRRRSKELKIEITRLQGEVSASVDREEELSRRLERLRAQYERMEKLAIRHTMEMMIRTIELAPEETAPALAVAVTGTTTTTTTTTSSPPLRPAAPLAASAAVQTDPGAEGHHPRTARSSPTVCDANVGTEPTQPGDDHGLSTTGAPPTLPLASAPQLQYEADAERFRERNAELVRSKAAVRVLKSEFQDCVERKNAAKATIKAWLAEFQAVHARDPTIEEKAQVKEMYLAFKECEEACNAAKERVSEAKARHHEKVLEVEALSQWHALAASLTATTSRDALSRPTTASTASSSRPLSREADALTNTSVAASSSVTAESIAEMERLQAELQGLRDELQRARDQADDLRLAAEPKTQAAAATSLSKGDGKGAKDPEPASKDGTTEDEPSSGRPPTAEAKAERSPSRPHSRDAAKEAMRERKLQEQAKEAKALEAQRDELRGAVEALLGEIAQRTQEKTRLDAQIEQMRLHLELMDTGSDAKGAEDLALAGGADESFTTSVAGDDTSTAEDDDEEDAALAVTAAEAKDTVGTEDERADHQRALQLVALVKEAVDAGKAHWNRGDKAKCYQTYVRACERALETLREMRQSHREEIAAFKAAQQEAGRLPPAKGSMVLRRQLDGLLATCEARTSEFEARVRAVPLTPSPQRRAQHKKSVAPLSPAAEAATGAGSSVAAASSPSPSVSTGSSGGSGPVNAKALEETRQKLRALEARAKADKVKIAQLEAALAKTESQLSTSMASSSNGGGGGNVAVLERRLAEAEKKHAKALEEAERATKRELAAVSQQLAAAQGRSQALTEQVETLSRDLARAGSRAAELSAIEGEVQALRVKAAQVDGLSTELGATRAELGKLEASYREEQALRKKYYNQIEDMKGKIRVYARCRPMSTSESERGCAPCVRFVDEFSLELQTSHGPKTFAYDQVFTPASTQDAVFEDTKNLLQSAVDGYNVCIFAYGQTGSGKTFTMTGSEGHPGLSPRAIHHLFRLADEAQGNHAITFQACMLELYNDALIDLLHLVDGGSERDAPKLEIKKNERGMVFVQNATIKPCTSAAQTLRLFEQANRRRQVGATKMNAESSRSHSVFALLVENYNKTTKATSVGKLSLVDLAGSERAGKTGATAERLKEAQAINKSLSALGDVIAALSANEKFIPYRNNKLTQLMQDSLGGNAKTLMFVNISPADYNQEETQTSLQYAARVKLITNSANKNSESEQVNRLKAIIRQLRAGKTDVDLDGVLDG